MHIPKTSDNLPEDDELYPQYNPVTQNPELVFSSEDEWLAMFSIVETQYNPATSELAQNDKD